MEMCSSLTIINKKVFYEQVSKLALADREPSRSGQGSVIPLCNGTIATTSHGTDAMLVMFHGMLWFEGKALG